MNSPSPGQIKVIGYIESNIGIKFYGKTKEDARHFISENIAESQKSSNAITTKQQEAINTCCMLLNIEFHGKSKSDARQFLMNHIENARKELSKVVKEQQTEHSTGYSDRLPVKMSAERAYSLIGLPYSSHGDNEFIETYLDLEDAYGESYSGYDEDLIGIRDF